MADRLLARFDDLDPRAQTYRLVALSVTMSLLSTAGALWWQRRRRRAR